MPSPSARPLLCAALRASAIGEASASPRPGSAWQRPSSAHVARRSTQGLHVLTHPWVGASHDRPDLHNPRLAGRGSTRERVGGPQTAAQGHDRVASGLTHQSLTAPAARNRGLPVEGCGVDDQARGTGEPEPGAAGGPEQAGRWEDDDAWDGDQSGLPPPSRRPSFSARCTLTGQLSSTSRWRRGADGHEPECSDCEKRRSLRWQGDL